MTPFWKKLLSQGSQTAPRIADDVVESNAIQKLAKELSEETPEVIGKGTSRGAHKAAEDIPDAVFSEITPTAPSTSLWDKLDKKKAAALLGLGGATGAYMMSGDENQEIPMAPASVSQVKAEEPKTPEEIKEEVKKTVEKEAPKKDGLDFKEQEKSDMTPDVDEMGEAQARADENFILAQLGKAATQIGSGLATVGAGAKVDLDSSGFDALAKAADRPVSQLKEKQGYEKAKAELSDEKAMRDPNSSISKLVSELATKTGLIRSGQQVSAMDLKNAGVNLGTLLATMEAGKARKEAAALSASQRAAQKKEKLSDNERKFVQQLRKEATSGQLGKQYATYSTGQRMSQALEEFAKNPSGYKDYATLMGGLKALQGDESVVREAEVRLGMSATSLFQSLQNQLQKAQSGKMLQPEQRQQMVETIRILTDLSKQQYMHAVKPILEQAQMENIDPSLILSGSLTGTNQSSQSAGETKKFNQQLTPGSTVTTKSGKRYKIGPDGQTGTLIQ